MRRWNGWGDEQVNYPLPPSAHEYLLEALGDGDATPDVEKEQLLKRIPKSRLPQRSAIHTSAEVRLRHARGQSMPDWIALRYGTINCFPDGVVYPEKISDVQEMLQLAGRQQFSIIPYGGGTSVVGHINPLCGDKPVLTLDMGKMDKLLSLDEESRLATFGAGISGPALENQLQKFGYTFGHYPQSFEYSTLGGWIATRSCGQQSYYYGRIEDLIAGFHLETPAGPLDIPPLPASAAGPDIRELILGSEGRLGVITHATVRIRRLPKEEAFYGVFFPHWEAGLQAIRKIAQEGVEISMARLSNSQETETTLELAGKPQLIKWVKRGLKLFGYGSSACLLIFGATGDAKACSRARKLVKSIAREFDGLFTGQTIGHTWEKSRFLTPYLRNSLWELGYAVDTLETAFPWSEIKDAADAIRNAIYEKGTSGNGRVLVMTHISHIYRDGGSVYITFLFRRSDDPDETLERWQKMKAAASQAIVEHKGTISHQHGIGTDHSEYLIHEKGPLGMKAIKTLTEVLDPHQIMNPGKLLP